MTVLTDYTISTQYVEEFYPNGTVSNKNQVFLSIQKTNQVTCNVHKIPSTELKHLCLSENARHRGSAYLGGIMKVDNFVEEIVDENGTRIHADILVDAHVHVRLIFFPPK